jgi:hypothetical protein
MKDFSLSLAGEPMAELCKEFGISPQDRLQNFRSLPGMWLGIGMERIRPGHHQQNGRHERMHLTLKKETTKARCFKLPSAPGQIR